MSSTTFPEQAQVIMRNADAGGDYELKVITDIDGQLPIPCVKEFSMFIKACLYVFIAICSIGSSGTVRASAMPYTPQDLASPSTATAVVMSYNIRLDRRPGPSARRFV